MGGAGGAGGSAGLLGYVGRAGDGGAGGGGGWVERLVTAVPAATVAVGWPPVTAGPAVTVATRAWVGLAEPGASGGAGARAGANGLAAGNDGPVSGGNGGKVAMAPTHRSPAVMAVTAVPVATAGWSVTVGPAVMAVTEPRVPAMPI